MVNHKAVLFAAMQDYLFLATPQNPDLDPDIAVTIMRKYLVVQLDKLAQHGVVIGLSRR